MEGKVDAKKIQSLSAIDTLILLQSLMCYRSYISPGNDSCITARRSYQADPEFVGRGSDTIPQVNQKFATVCETCPVLLTAYGQVFGK